MTHPRIGAWLAAFLAASHVSCDSGSTSPSGSPVAAGTTVAAATPTPTPTATVTPTPTATPGCSFELSAATFEPNRIVCPSGSSTQQVRVIFRLSTGNHVPVSIERVSSVDVQCQASRATCQWGAGNLSFSPQRIEPGTSVQIVATQSFNCGATGSGGNTITLTFRALGISTTCGPVRETLLTNVLQIAL